MAKIINIFDSKAQEKKNDWRKVLTGKEYEVLKYNSFFFLVNGVFRYVTIENV